MKKYLLPLVIALCLASCRQSVSDCAAIRRAVSNQLETHPESRLQDLYKSFFQDRFGPGHIIRDRESARNYILSELAGADSLGGPVTEVCGWEGNYVRVNLSVIADSLMSVDELTEALMASAIEVRDEDIEAWKEEWQEILSVIEKHHPEITDMEEDKAMLDSLLASGRYACHHSDAYNAAYHPHYRIIARDLLPYSLK
ncbi:MAG: hypothetical protein ACI399_02690 [Candidatus Cryptobacteroides sp.]